MLVELENGMLLELSFSQVVGRYGICRHCGLVESVRTWDGTGCEIDSWQCRIYIYIYPMFIEPMITLVSSGFSGYIWLNTKIVLKKIYAN